MPERVGEHTRPLNEVRETPDTSGSTPLVKESSDPQWLVDIPVQGHNQRYVIDPTQIFLRERNEKGELLKERVEKLDKDEIGSIEDLEKLFSLRAVNSNESPYVVLYPENGPRDVNSRRLLGQKVAIELVNPSKIQQIAKESGAESGEVLVLQKTNLFWKPLTAWRLFRFGKRSKIW